jgi:NAD(P)-dependent dehydrogenase (short-subunit alcohol dehydrogenase family)
MNKLVRIICLSALTLLTTLGTQASAAPGTILITGANRGIGLELASQYKARGFKVIGTARKPEQATELEALGVQVEALDVTDSESVAALASRLDGIALDILINNAGISGYNAASFQEFDFDQVMPSFDVNSLGPMRVTQALYKSLAKGSGKKVVHISSTMGSIAQNRGGYYGYRASKAALNMFNKSLAMELGPEGFISVVLHPGWVRTRMGGDGAQLSTQESVTGMVSVIEQLKPASNGHFYDYQGKELPW